MQYFLLSIPFEQQSCVYFDILQSSLIFCRKWSQNAKLGRVWLSKQLLCCLWFVEHLQNLLRQCTLFMRAFWISQLCICYYFIGFFLIIYVIPSTILCERDGKRKHSRFVEWHHCKSTEVKTDIFIFKGHHLFAFPRLVTGRHTFARVSAIQ